MTVEEVKASTLYTEYRSWGEENKEYIFSSTKFGAEISKHYDKVKRRDGLYYVGINLDVPNDDFSPCVNLASFSRYVDISSII